MINVKYNRDSDTYYIGKEDEKKFIVIDSSHDEENIKRRMRKRKNKDSIDEISQELLIKQKNQTKNKHTNKMKIIAAKKIANWSSRNRSKKTQEKQK